MATTTATDDGVLLLRAVCSNPADDTARLVYADWLDEQGDRESRCRAEFVRVQIAISRRAKTNCIRTINGRQYDGGPTAWQLFTPRCRCQMCSLRRREYETSKRYCSWDWCRGIPAGSMNTYTRGFVSEIELPCADFLKHAKAVFRAHPVTAVRLAESEPLNCADEGETPAYVWVRAFRGDTRFMSWEIPYDVWGPEVNGTFDTDEKAADAASRRCVAFGRLLAKLPPLPAGVAA